MRLRALALVALLALGPAYAQTDANLAHPHRVVTVQRDGYTVSGLVTHLADAKTLKYAVALFPGHPGIIKLREEAGQPSFGMRGNFLIRSRRHWLDQETLVAVIDAPSDQWASFEQRWRETARYGADVEALLREIGRHYGVEDWTYVGTSEGSISAFHAARMNPAVARRVILTSSVFRAGKNGPGLSSARWEDIAVPLLWVHHEDDPCVATLYRDAREFSRRSGKPLVTVRGGDVGRGNPCEAQTAHGFVGVERETVLAMRSWIKSGAVPADVKRGGS